MGELVRILSGNEYELVINTLEPFLTATVIKNDYGILDIISPELVNEIAIAKKFVYFEYIIYKYESLDKFLLDIALSCHFVSLPNYYKGPIMTLKSYQANDTRIIFAENTDKIYPNMIGAIIDRSIPLGYLIVSKVGQRLFIVCQKYYDDILLKVGLGQPFERYKNYIRQLCQNMPYQLRN